MDVFPAHRPVRSFRVLLAVLLAPFAGALLAGPAAAQQLDHFMCYGVSSKAINVGNVQLQDQFDVMAGIVEIVQVNRPIYFCNPVRKTRPGHVSEIIDPTAHLKWYSITTAAVPNRVAIVRNQFGPEQKLSIKQPKWLAVPTAKDNLPFPQQLDHFKCYAASGSSVNATVTLEDQFELDRNFVVLRPQRYCNPVRKVHGAVIVDIRYPQGRLVCYDVARPAQTANQFGQETLWIRKMSLCVPSELLKLV
jgi:hypothetical protein